MAFKKLPEREAFFNCCSDVNRATGRCEHCGIALCSDHQASHTLEDCENQLRADIAFWGNWGRLARLERVQVLRERARPMDVEAWDQLVAQANEMRGGVTLEELCRAAVWAHDEGVHEFTHMAASEWVGGLRALIECYAAGR